MDCRDQRIALLAAYENVAVVVAGVRADELGDVTPCPGYDVAGRSTTWSKPAVGRRLSTGRPWRWRGHAQPAEPATDDDHPG